MSKLSGKVAWISGATSGIGEATARLFAREGACITMAGRRLALGKRIAAQLQAEGAKAMAVACDVSNEAQVRNSIRRTVERFGRLDILVNNAGMVHVKALHQHTAQQWHRGKDVTGTSLVIDAGYLTAAEWDSGKTSKRQHPRSREVPRSKSQRPSASSTI